MTDELAGAERELRRAREALAHTEHGADDSMAQIRYVRALTVRNKARATLAAMPDLPPEVRDRAAHAAEASMSEWGEHYNDVDRRMTLEVVDAVAEVLAETPGEPRDRIVGWLSAAAALTDVTREPCAEALCPEIFRETGQRCDKPDDGHTKHTYALWEHGVQVELAAWVTPDDA